MKLKILKGNQMFKCIVPVLFLFTSSAYAMDANDPYDFNYVVNGKNNRPMNVFNDGDTTYIQPKDQQLLFIDKYPVNMRGPYYTIKGVPDVIEGYTGGDAFRIVWQGATKQTIANEQNRANGDLAAKTFSGTFGRIAFLNGLPPDVAINNALPGQLQLREALKALAPHGWSGSADRGINTTQTVAINSQKGESWVVVLDRLMTASSSWLEMDSNSKTLYLREAPPKGFSIVLENQSQDRTTANVTVGELPEVADATSKASQVNSLADTDRVLDTVHVKEIAQSNGQTAIILSNSSDHIEIMDLNRKTTVQPSKVSTVEYRIPILENFEIRNQSGNAVEVKRVFNHVPQVKLNNQLGLRKVEEQNGKTIFSFAHQLPEVKFINAMSQSNNCVWVKNECTISAVSPEWKISTPQSATLVEVVDQGVYLWRIASSNPGSISKASPESEKR
ncbi:hypothetical protein [Undibacterium oligocarboniphilum]|uniref:Uncharacterized protein n=1 Tax=Undibacterium oligocarboniphilum TaxID=666702 RepID=A0A850QMW5_9BURK|nr:hypothetical protein [Undibacterium oligocarboniphilum]MBC3871439.1 hypothetical protein [Undibacterium oligocarboniphilum]NVO78985.1 hypothetical protein [Undibacterium oligocarboniphilum]